MLGLCTATSLVSYPQCILISKLMSPIDSLRFGQMKICLPRGHQKDARYNLVYGKPLHSSEGHLSCCRFQTESEAQGDGLEDRHGSIVLACLVLLLDPLYNPEAQDSDWQVH